MAGIEALGRLIDLSVCVAPVDLAGGPETGKLVSLEAASGVTVVLFKGAASAGTDPSIEFQEAQDSAGTGLQVMASPPGHYYQKAAASLAGTETWTKKTATYSSNVLTFTGEEGNQGIFAFEIHASDLSDGFAYVGVTLPDAGTVAQIGGALYILHDLSVQRTPANLAAALS